MNRLIRLASMTAMLACLVPSGGRAVNAQEGAAEPANVAPAPRRETIGRWLLVGMPVKDGTKDGTMWHGYLNAEGLKASLIFNCAAANASAGPTTAGLIAMGLIRGQTTPEQRALRERRAGEISLRIDDQSATPAGFRVTGGLLLADTAATAVIADRLRGHETLVLHMPVGATGFTDFSFGIAGAAEALKSLADRCADAPWVKEVRPRTDAGASPEGGSAIADNAVDFKALIAAEEPDLRAAIERNWNVPMGLPDLATYVLELRLHMNPDGTLASIERLPSAQSGPNYEAFASGAERAVKLTALEDGGLPLPKDRKYSTILLRFDMSQICAEIGC